MASRSPSTSIGSRSPRGPDEMLLLQVAYGLPFSGHGGLVAMRFVEGAAMIVPAAIAALRRLPTPAEFGRAMARWGGVSVVGAIGGFVASGAVATWVSWRSMFTFPVAVAAFGLAALPSLLPGDATGDAGDRRPRLDPGGAEVVAPEAAR